MHRAPTGWGLLRSQLEVERSNKEVVKPDLGTTFDSLTEVYGFYNLYSWEHDFGIRYGKSRLNPEKRKTMQEIVCGCSGKPLRENTRSCRCECPTMIRLLQTTDNEWYITEHRVQHNRVMTRSCGEMPHWPSHKHIDGTLEIFSNKYYNSHQWFDDIAYCKT